MNLKEKDSLVALGFMMILLITTSITFAQEKQTLPPWTGIHYLDGKETTVPLNPIKGFAARRPKPGCPKCHGGADINLKGPEVEISLEIKGLPESAGPFYLYVVDSTNKAVKIARMEHSYKATHTLPSDLFNTFMLVVSPEEDLASIARDTNLIMISGVPKGVEIAPRHNPAEKQPKDK